VWLVIMGGEDGCMTASFVLTGRDAGPTLIGVDSETCLMGSDFAPFGENGSRCLSLFCPPPRLAPLSVCGGGTGLRAGHNLRNRWLLIIRLQAWPGRSLIRLSKVALRTQSLEIFDHGLSVIAPSDDVIDMKHDTRSQGRASSTAAASKSITL
jgi:hypothetical protein